VHPYDLAKSIFLQALDLPGDERTAFVRAECQGDVALLADVEGLLAHHDDALGVIEQLDQREAVPERIGEFTIVGELGRGGMGVVWDARRPDGAPVALKVLRRGLLSPTLLARFRREAEVLGRLDHPGIAHLIETGVEATASGSRPWLAMQRVDGVPLRAWARGPGGTAERLELLACVCDAVEHAHRHGVVHRDLKPENILVRPDGQPVVLDFGVARMADSDVRATTVMTSAGLIVGTIRYMSPEQAEADPAAIGPRSDVYALGVIAYELLAGRLPYEVPANSVHRALVAVMTAPPRPMEGLPAPVRRRLERVLRAALAKSPGRRLADARSLGEDLRRIAAGREPLARPVREPGPAASRGRALLALGSAAALVGIALSVWRTPPTPFDWAQGLLRPNAMFERAVAALDSATVRLHFTTRTLAREREALAYAQRARTLVRTLGVQPYAPQLERLALFRQGEAEYLIAERTNDVARFEAAAKLWYLSREPSAAPRPVAVPDSSGISIGGLYDRSSASSWFAASMALADAARLANPQVYFRRSLDLAREGARAFDRQRSAGREASADRARARAAEGAGVQARLGVALVGFGFHAIAPESLRAGLERLRAAVRDARRVEDLAAYASHLHELGAGETRLAALERDPAAVDSAIAHLGAALELRSGLDGYTSRFVSRLELAQAHRLAARFARADGRALAHLAAAGHLLAITPADRRELGATDEASFTIARAALGTDLCCFRRDTSALAALDVALAGVLARLDRRRAPLLLYEAQVEHARIESQRYALGGDTHLLRQANQAFDLAGLPVGARGSDRMRWRLGVGKARLFAARRPFDPDYPTPEPF
jgi:predicted Ser/Thr protein kinase